MRISKFVLIYLNTILRGLHYMLVVKYKKQNRQLDSMEQRVLEKLSVCSGNQQIPLILRRPKIRYSVYNNPPPAPLLCQINPIHTPNLCLPKTN